MSFNLSHPYLTLYIILLYSKEVVSRTLCSLSTIASRVAATADNALYNLLIFPKCIHLCYISFVCFLFAYKSETFIIGFLSPN